MADKPTMKQAIDILNRLREIEDGNYTEEGRFTLCQEIANLGVIHHGWIWKALAIAHMNGQRQAARIFQERAKGMIENAELVSALHMPIEEPKQ